MKNNPHLVRVIGRVAGEHIDNTRQTYFSEFIDLESRWQKNINKAKIPSFTGPGSAG